MERNLVEKALEYAARGWKVFPLHTMIGSACSCRNVGCSSAAKHPHIKEWQKSCSYDSDEIRGWWQQWPDANIGLATGNASGLIVLDIDPIHGGKESMLKLAKKNGILPKTLASSTGGDGYQLYFKHPDMKIRNRCKILPGVDVRSDGDYIVAPPSLHKSGMRYDWLKLFADRPIVEAPEWLLSLFITKKPSRPSSDFSSTFIGEGARNTYLTYEARRLHLRGIDGLELD